MERSPLRRLPAQRFRAAPLVAVVALALIGIGLAANWYARDVSLPRYCENPAQTLIHLERVLNQPEPAGDAARRPYLIAAKLLFLIPRATAESNADYLDRIRHHLRRSC